MRHSVGALGLVALFRLASAQSQCAPLTTLFPSCALGCVNDAASNVGCTDPLDLSCRCVSSAAIEASAVPCVQKSCSPSDFGPALAAPTTICACVSSAAAAGPTPTSTTSTSTSSKELGANPQPPSPAPETSSSSSSEKPSVKAAPPATTPAAKQLGSSCGHNPCQASVDAVPMCASKCIEDAAVSSAHCGLDDFGCQCKSAAVIEAGAAECVASACPNSVPQVLAAVTSLCGCVAASPATPCPGSPGPTVSPSPVSSGSSGSPGSPGPSCSGPTTPDCAPVAATAIPSCASACFASAAPSVHCQADDFSCQCQPAAQASLTQILVPCVQSACPASMLPDVISGASKVCECAAAAPTGGSCPAGSGSGSGSGSGVGGGPGVALPVVSSPAGCIAARPPPAVDVAAQDAAGTTCMTSTITRSNGTVTSTLCFTAGAHVTNPPVAAAVPTTQGTGAVPVAAAPAGAHYEIGLVAGVFGAVWMLAVAL